MVKNEFKNLLKNKILLISVIAITFIPIIYTSIFDKSLWDPYGGIKNFPVAVVNEDESVELMGQKVNVGDQVIDNLKKDKELDWKFVSEKQAMKGLKELDYYMIITIPKDFSKSAASVIDADPKKMEITYTTNDSYNYIGKEISQVAATELEMKVRNQVVQAYASAVDTAAGKMVGALNQAADGSNELYSGSGQLANGINAYTNGVSQADDGSKKLAGGTAQLAAFVGPLSSGVSQLDAGSKELSNALGGIDAAINSNQAKITEADAGVESLSVAARLMAESLQNFENNLNPEIRVQLSKQIEALDSQLNELIVNANELASISMDSSQLDQKNTEISRKLLALTDEFDAANQSINSKISDIIQKNEELSERLKSELIKNLNAAVDSDMANLNQRITNKINDINKNLEELSNITLVLAQQANEVSNISGSMAKNTQNVQVTFSEFKKGNQQIEMALGVVPASESAQSIVNQLNQLSAVLNHTAEDIPTAVAGVHKLASGSEQLTGGLNQLQGKLPELSSGVDQLNAGSDQLEDGLDELNSKSPELVSGIKQLQAGAGELANGLDSGVDKAKSVKVTHKTIDQFVDPTGLKNDQYSKVKNYGEALAPYIMSLALFVGCMLFNFVYPIRKSSMDGQSSLDWWLSKVSLGFVVSSLMAIIQVTTMILLGLPVYNLGLLYLTALITAWCYMSIVMFLAMTFDNPGRFAAMILLVLQLGGAAGTFPIQTQGKFFQLIHPFLPMSYSLYAFREAIAGGISNGLVNKSYTILLVLMVLFVSLLRISMFYLQKNHLRDVSLLNDNQKLMALEVDDHQRLSSQIDANIKKEKNEEEKK
ncbi:YhgE/Pip domain-containing protein [Enterococcus gilvus]|nr:YhgE/Pip domain-containing protein [Enterococcus gilvus]